MALSLYQAAARPTLSRASHFAARSLALRVPTRTLRGSASAARRGVHVTAGEKPILYDMPVSNNGARCRLVLYWKGLEDKVDVVSPSELGGLKSEEYLALNPQGKMPLLVLPSGQALPESEVISQYLVNKYDAFGPSLIPPTPEAAAKANLASRIHDIYIVSIQAAMYRAMDIKEREAAIAQIAMQLGVLEDLCEAGPYFVGDKPSTADAALFPTFIFMTFMLPSKFGWDDVFTGKPKLKDWYEQMKNHDEAGSRVYEEINSALQGWDESGRWEKLGINEQVADSSYKWAY